MRLNNSRKAQSTVQFMFLIGFMFIVLIVFVSYQATRIDELEEQKEYVLLKDIALAVASEIHLATGVEDGYIRNFSIPLLLDGIDYNLNRTGNEIILASENEDYSVTVPEFNGTLVKGNNQIRIVGGNVCVNEGCS